MASVGKPLFKSKWVQNTLGGGGVGVSVAAGKVQSLTLAIYLIAKITKLCICPCIVSVPAVVCMCVYGTGVSLISRPQKQRCDAGVLSPLVCLSV